mmetsp:Transcript_3826/g.7322  ORF Transcript_3826/g.7322 Transcript_3826/m.7322 type:complete len:463 (+) Transcript_3826:153-1541(+)
MPRWWQRRRERSKTRVARTGDEEWLEFLDQVAKRPSVLVSGTVQPALSALSSRDEFVEFITGRKDRLLQKLLSRVPSVRKNQEDKLDSDPLEGGPNTSELPFQAQRGGVRRSLPRFLLSLLRIEPHRKVETDYEKFPDYGWITETDEDSKVISTAFTPSDPSDALSFAGRSGRDITDATADTTESFASARFTHLTSVSSGETRDDGDGSMVMFSRMVKDVGRENPASPSPEQDSWSIRPPTFNSGKGSPTKHPHQKLEAGVVVSRLVRDIERAGNSNSPERPPNHVCSPFTEPLKRTSRTSLGGSPNSSPTTSPTKRLGGPSSPRGGIRSTRPQPAGTTLLTFSAQRHNRSGRVHAKGGASTRATNGSMSLKQAANDSDDESEVEVLDLTNWDKPQPAGPNSTMLGSGEHEREDREQDEPLFPSDSRLFSDNEIRLVREEMHRSLSDWSDCLSATEIEYLEV